QVPSQKRFGTWNVERGTWNVELVLRPRMELGVDRFQATAIDVRVVLRGLNRGVAEEFLHGSQVRAAAEQVRGEAVPQRVRADADLEPGPTAILLHQLPEHDSRDRPPGTTEEDSVGGWRKADGGRR